MSQLGAEKSPLCHEARAGPIQYVIVNIRNSSNLKLLPWILVCQVSLEI